MVKRNLLIVLSLLLLCVVALLAGGWWLLASPQGQRRLVAELSRRAAVTIERPFWMAEVEISNRQFALFDDKHDSGYQDAPGKDQSVRGYAYQSLGPRDSSGEVVGGKHLLVGSVELERPLSENWGLALFFDAGNAFDSFSDYELFEGAGCGLRRYTPVGPLKVDLARQVGVSDPSYRLHVSIGFTW